MKFFKLLGIILLTANLAHALATVSSQIGSLAGTGTINSNVIMHYGITQNGGVYSDGTKAIYSSVLGLGVSAIPSVSISSDGGESTATISADENQQELTIITIRNSTGAVTYVLSGEDARVFSIDTNGVLTFTNPPDYETTKIYTVEVTATDDGTHTSSTQTITVNITNVNEIPIFTNSGATTATEESPYTYTASVSDPDGDFASIVTNSLPDWLSLATGPGSKVVSTFAGSGAFGSTDADGTSASFDTVRGLATDSLGNLYVADIDNKVIRKIDTNGTVTTFAGTGLSGSVNVNGDKDSATFDAPVDIAIDRNDNIYIVDLGYNNIRKIDTNGTVTTVAGSERRFVWDDVDAVGTAARFNFPMAIAVDNNSNVYVADKLNNKIRKIDINGVVTTLAGTGAWGSDDGIGSVATFSDPSGIAVTKDGTVYVSDTFSNKIRKIDVSGNVTTFAGSGEAQNIDAVGTLASIYTPAAMILDATGNLYVIDSGNTIRKIDSSAKVTTVAGSGLSGDRDGSWDTARFNKPSGIAIDADGVIYVSDTGNNVIRKISAAELSLEGTPTVAGVYDVNLTVTDGNLSSIQNYQITVGNVNDAPIMFDTAFVVGENSIVGSTVGLVGAYDEDAISPSADVMANPEVLTYSITSGNTNSDFRIDPLSGELIVANTLNSFLTSTYTLIVMVQDDDLASSSASVNITVSEEDGFPVAVDDNTTIDEDTNASINLTLNDTDPDNNLNSASVVITQEPSYGTVRLDANGTATYIPNKDYVGDDYFTYKVYDETSLESNEANATITMNPINDAPVAFFAIQNTQEDTNTSVMLRDYVLDVDIGDILTYEVIDNPLNGTVLIDAVNGIVTYSPNSNFYGFDSFTYRANDSMVDSNIAMIMINIAEVNDIPVAYNDYDNNTSEDTPINIAILANDTDDEGLDRSTIAILNAPKHGIVTLEANETITYAPDENWYGTDSFEYTVKDTGLQTGTQSSAGILISNAATVIINVSSVIDLPLVNDDNVTLYENSIYKMNIHSNDTYVDGVLDGTGIIIVTEPTHGQAYVLSTGLVLYIPTQNYFGVDSFTYMISIGDINSSIADVNLSILSVNDIPMFISDAQQSISENSIETIVSLSAQDVEDNTPFIYTKVAGKDADFFTLSGSDLSFTKVMDYEYPQDANADNIYVIDIMLTDSAGASVIQTFNIEVVNMLINDENYIYVDNGDGTQTSAYVKISGSSDSKITHITVPNGKPVSVTNNEDNSTTVLMDDPNADIKITSTGGLEILLDETNGKHNIVIANLGADIKINDDNSMSLTTPVLTNTNGSTCVYNLDMAYDGSDLITKHTLGQTDGSFIVTTVIMKLPDADLEITSDNRVLISGALTNLSVATSIDCSGAISTTTKIDEISATYVAVNTPGSTVIIYENGDVDTSTPLEINASDENILTGLNFKIDSESGTVLSSKVFKDATTDEVTYTEANLYLAGTALSVNGNTIAEIEVDLSDVRFVEITTSDSQNNVITSTTQIDTSIPDAEISRTSNGETGAVTTKITTANSNITIDNFLDGKSAYTVDVGGITTTNLSNLEGTNIVVNDNGVSTSYEDTTGILKAESNSTVDGFASHMLEIDSLITRASFEVIGAATVIDNDENGDVKISTKLNTTNTNNEPFEIEVDVTSDGHSAHTMRINNVLTKATFEIAGANTVVKDSGDIFTDIVLDKILHIIASVKAFSDGSAAHEVKGDDFNTTVTFDSGATTVISADGEVYTSVNKSSTQCTSTSLEYSGVSVTTSVAGYSTTRFATYLCAGDVFLQEDTTFNTEFSLPKDSNVSIKEVNGAKQMIIIMPLDDEIRL